LDFVFRLKRQESWEHVRQVEVMALCGLFKKKRNIVLDPQDCYNMFFRSSFCMDKPLDKWSLISLVSLETNIDIKVFYSSSRTYAFSIDSFEIDIDPYLQNFTTRPTIGKNGYPQNDNKKIRARVTHKSSVEFYSNYPSIDEALCHLRQKIISTNNFSEIHHGLFRYCLELSRGYRLENASVSELKLVEKFWDEFEQMGLSGFKMTLAKFVSKHQNHWFNILSNMYEVIKRYSYYHSSSADVLDVILKFLFRKN